MRNNRFDQYKRMLRIISVALIVAVETLIFYITWRGWYSDDIYLYKFAVKGHWFMIGMYILFSMLFLYIYGGLKLGYFKQANMIYSQSLSVVCVNVITYLEIVLLYREVAPPIPILIMTGVDVAVIAVLSFGFDKIYAKLFPPRRTLIIYGEDHEEILFPKIIKRRDKYIIEQTVSDEIGFEALSEMILKYEAVILSDVHAPLRNTILKFCYGHSIRVYMTPKISDIIIRSSEMLHLFDTPLLLARNNGLTFEQKFLKRFMDIVCSLLLIIVSSPLMAVAAAAIRLYDHGPVLFKQKRLTIDRKEFYVYKFRSMVVDAEKDGVARLATKNDSRITPVGKVIRKLRIDELPQLFNVLSGAMSLVGPRPERPEIAAEYEQDTPEFTYRLKVKAGLTGYAQVYGKYNTTAYDKLKLDLMYIESYSILVDIKILIMTFKILFMEESTEGLDENQTTASTAKKKKKDDQHP